MEISPALYKALKDENISQAQEIEYLKIKLHFMEQELEKQNETIRKLDRIIDALL